jgi:hypothetical protein
MKALVLAAALLPLTLAPAAAQDGPMPVRYKDLSSDFVYSRGSIFWPVAGFGYRVFDAPYLFACGYGSRWNCAASDLKGVLAGGQDFLVQPPEVEFSTAGIAFNAID